MAETYGIFTVACVVAISFTIRDILMATEMPNAMKKEQVKQAENAKLSTETAGPTIKFLICYG